MIYDANLSKSPTLALLYALLALALIGNSFGHYYLGHYEALLIHLIAIPTCIFASLYLFLIREPGISVYVSQGTLLLLAALIQYQLAFNIELGIHWLYCFPILSYFALSLRSATLLNLAMLVACSLQLMQLKTGDEVARTALGYLMMGAASWCYAYLNKLKQKSLLKLAVTDNQSGAYNSRHLAKMLEQEIARSKVTKRTLSLISITIEDYVQVIEIHGQTATEALLHHFRNELMFLVRAGDETFHDGQGTFYLLLPNCPMEGAVVLKERLQTDLAQRQWPVAGELQLNTGIATLNDNEQADSFLQRASQHLFKQQQTALKLMAFS